MFLRSRNSVKPFDFDGLSIRDLTGDAGLSASFAEIEVEPGVKHKASRSSRSDKYYFCTKGKLSFTVGKESLVLLSGDLLIIEQGEWFDYRNDEESPAQLLLIHVPSFILEAEEFKDEMPE